MLADYDAACARSRVIDAGLRSEDTVPEPQLGRMSLRWVYVHMIDETARHAGHADIIRELIDGSTGDRSESRDAAGNSRVVDDQP